MLELNKIQKTITGKEVKPFTVQGDIVYCFNSKGEVIYVNIKEFDFAKKKEKKTIYVNPIENLNTDVIFEEKEQKDGFFEEPKKDKPKKEVKPIEKTKEVKKKPKKEVKPVEKTKVVKNKKKDNTKITPYIPDDDYI